MEEQIQLVEIKIENLGRNTFSFSLYEKKNQRIYSEMFEETTSNTATFLAICRTCIKFPEKHILVDNRAAFVWASGGTIRTKLPSEKVDFYSKLIESKKISPRMTLISR